jgi:uncharacterized LabA/DUF88 family protein
MPQGLGRGYFSFGCSVLRPAPDAPRAISFVDGQNLFHCARDQFGYLWPNYDVLALSEAVCRRHAWTLQQVRFYTGIPERRHHPALNAFWVRKLSAMGNQGIHVYSRHLRCRTVRTDPAQTDSKTVMISEEKGIDVRIAIDVIRLASRRAYDVALLFSQDQDFAEVAIEVREIAREQDRWIKIASAFPAGSHPRRGRGIDRTDWIPIDRQTYEACLDRGDFQR